MKKILSFLGATTFFVFSSCDENDNTPPDTTKPEIIITSPSEADFYQDDIIITASATDNAGVTTMDIYFDGTLVHSNSADEITATVSTTDYEDGPHILKVVAKDAAGNETSIARSVTLLNTVITLNILSFLPAENTDYYYYLLDEENKQASDVIKVTANTAEIKFSTPANHTINTKYTLAAFERREGHEFFSDVSQINMAAGYRQGSYNKLVGQLPSSTISSTASHTVHLQDFSNPLLVNAHSGPFGLFLPHSGSSFSIPLEEDGADAYLAVLPSYEEGPVYKLLSNLTSGSETDLNPEDFTPMDGVDIAASDGVLSTVSVVEGFKTEGDYSQGRLVWLNYTGATSPLQYVMQMYYPGNHFPEYRSFMNETFMDTGEDYQVFGATPPSEFKRISAEVIGISQTTTTLSAEIQGTYDYVILNGGIYSSDPSIDSYTWSVTLSAEDAAAGWLLPEVPQELIDLYDFPPSSEWQSAVTVSIGDYSGLEGYEEYFESNFNDITLGWNYFSWAKHSREFLFKYKRFDQAGGKKQDSSPFHFLPNGHMDLRPGDAGYFPSNRIHVR
ncbi:MAG TPA: Ig-like domain-containing protein [Chryseosolibacter sp.]|nr:Ig-like domain-containing protein [Chryseosolibacter sp.]